MMAPEAEVIKSLSNSRIKYLRKYLADGKARRRDGVWVAEGVRLAEEVLASGLTIHEAFIVEGWEGERSLELERALAERGVKLLKVSRGVMSQTSDTVTSQGVALVFQAPRHELDDVFKGVGPLLILDRIRDPGNLGTIARSAAASGGGGLLLTPETVDPGNPKALRSSAGALLKLPFARIGDATSVKKSLGRPLYATSGVGGKFPEALDLASPFALLIGHEAQGLSPEWLDSADGLITIPMAAGVESLNAATAAAVVLFEAARQRRQKA